MTGRCLSQEEADEFAIGSLDPLAEAEIAAHLRSCQACLGLVNLSLQVAAALSFAVPSHRAPASLRRRTFLAAGVARPRMITRVLRAARSAAAVAAALIAVAALAGMIILRGQVHDLSQENTDLSVQVNEALSQKIEILALTSRLNEEERRSADLMQAARGDRDLLLALLSPESDVAEVFAVEESAYSLGRLVWDRGQKKVWFVASRLRPLSDGETYQIWASSGGKYHSLGTFNADSSGFARYEAMVPQGLESYESAVVTIERAGGSPERTGASVFVADLSRFRR
ncbi:MAG: anti-sigma factor [Dehalococcoidia bacterium]|nr:hypothetical protein [Chloroflexi bacterium CFX7]MCK6563859.1 anti-sigma factor [Dehalococcoidia bacterium]MCL4231757.1 anti-sigma factor [Dehalococcoidia bacterium]NUQ55164.1 anti-sigma factor [Dehalococcoidia bacterium]RIL03279.1 MAG: hypothetical protein DCC78_04420 [bacterium]